MCEKNIQCVSRIYSVYSEYTVCEQHTQRLRLNLCNAPKCSVYLLINVTKQCRGCQIWLVCFFDFYHVVWLWHKTCFTSFLVIKCRKATCTSVKDGLILKHNNPSLLLLSTQTRHWTIWKFHYYSGQNNHDKQYFHDYHENIFHDNHENILNKWLQNILKSLYITFLHYMLTLPG